MNKRTDISAGIRAPAVVNLVIETSKGSNNIYKYDGSTDSLFLQQVMDAPAVPSGNLGFIPQTYNEGGFSLDAILLSSHPHAPLSVVEARPVALLRTTAGGLRDDKIICIGIKDTTLSEPVSPHVLYDIRGFLQALARKDGVVIAMEEFLGAEEATRAVERGLSLFKRASPET